jgi:hypothetical protein
VDAVLVGPEIVRTVEAEDILGVSADLVLRSRAKRAHQQQNGMDFDEETLSSLDYDGPMIYDEMSRPIGGGGNGNRYNRGGPSRLVLGLRDLFVMYARSGESSGQHITLTQSDRWLKQANVVDNWNITSTDTAIAYRKISRLKI